MRAMAKIILFSSISTTAFATCVDFSGKYDTGGGLYGRYEIWMQKGCSEIEVSYQREDGSVSIAGTIYVDGVPRQWGDPSGPHYYDVNTFVEDSFRRTEIYFQGSQEIATAKYKMNAAGDLEKFLTRQYRGTKPDETFSLVLKRVP